ncbi:MAG: ferredoxin [Bacilli bacterium]|nr:ferredoxin [Bacilli bacterium]
MTKLKVDNQECICCGSCTAICEDVFGWSDDGTACVKDESKIEENKELVDDAVKSCPTGAIKMEEN